MIAKSRLRPLRETRLLLAFLALGALAACVRASDPASTEDDVSATRGIVGVPADIPVADKSPAGAARLSDALSKDMQKRRAHAWEVLQKSSRPFKIAGKGGLPNVHIPLWMTWYEGDEIGEILQIALDAKKNGTSLSAPPSLSADDVDVAMKIHARKARGIRTSGSFQKPLVQDRALGRRSTSDTPTRVLLETTGFTLFSPAYVRHVLRNYSAVADCGTKDTTKPAVFDLPALDPKVHTANFSAPCLDAEFPADAVMVKAVWRPLAEPVPFYDTSATGLTKIFSDVSTSWEVARSGAKTVDPTKREILSATDDKGKSWGLVALHLSTKETRNWAWSTYFWAPTELAKKDFGADRDANLFVGAAPDDSTQAIHEMLNNYKMCTTTDFSENDDAIATRFGTAGDLGTLSAALATADELVNAAPKSSGRPVTDVDGAKLFGHPAPRATWCSNPYVEHHPGNTHTNCIGCHQHAGTGISFNETFYLGTPAAEWHNFPKYGTSKVRGEPRSNASATPSSGTFPTDFSWGGEFEIRPMFQDLIDQSFPK